MVSAKLGLALFFIGVIFILANYHTALNAVQCEDCWEKGYASFVSYPIEGIPVYFIVGGVTAVAGFIIIFITFTLKRTLLLLGLGFFVYVIFNAFVTAVK